MTRILYVIETLGIGGAETQLLKLQGYMDRERFESHVCYLYGSSDLVPDFEEQGVEVHCLALKHRHQWLRGIMRLTALVRKIQPDLIHTSLFNSNLIGRFASTITRKPLICSLTSTNYEPVRYEYESISPFKHKIVKYIDSITGRIFVDRFIAVTPFVKESMVRRLGLSAGKISVIARGLDGMLAGTDGCEPPDDLRDVLRGRWPVLINVGRLVEQKGHSFVIKAVGILKQKYPGIILLVAGGGPRENELRGLINEQALDGNVVLLGVRRDIKELLAVSDIFVFPSIYEGAANAIVEAAGMGKPCVAFDTPNLKSVVTEEFCRFSELGSPESLAKEIDWLCSNKDKWRQMGMVASNWVLEHNNFDNIARMTEELYEKVVSGAVVDVGL